MGPLKTQIAKEILRKNKAESTLPNFKLQYKAIVSKQCGTGKKETQTSGTESRAQKKPSHTCDNTILNGETKISSKNAVGKTG